MDKGYVTNNYGVIVEGLVKRDYKGYRIQDKGLGLSIRDMEKGKGIGSPVWPI